ncbi:ribonuclease Y [Candidatus Woesebacteria bacterium]|nr:ribonuclease Y [Candidatus Woesebacteria bacterium]
MSFFSNLSTLFGADSKSGVKRHIPVQPIKPRPQVQQQPQKNAAVVEKKAEEQKISQPVAVAPVISAAMLDEQDVVREARSKAREIVVEAKAEALAIRSKAEMETRELAKQLDEQQRKLDFKLDKIEERLSQMTEKEDGIEKERLSLEEVKKNLSKQKADLLKKLEETSGLTTDEARHVLLDELDATLNREKARLIKQKEEEAVAEAETKVKDILIDAMKHGATDYVSEYTVSVVTLPSEDAKGKIIGKSGRNINAFERATGVDVDLDMSPTEVRLSCFDPVRREIARISLERLVKDGRIQPTRIEEVVDRVKMEIDKITFEAGKALCHDLGIYNLPIDLMKMIGKFKYRFSYGQNLIAHTLEETRIGIKLASELKIDVNTVKLGCLLHDIGKVSEESEGSHVELGIKIAKRFNLPQAVVDCIAQHHEDEPFSGPEQMIVYIADAISGARPGARYENYDEYVKRLQQLEQIATKYDEVEQAYAIQAGREVRVLLKPAKSKDDDVRILSLKIRDEIKNTMTYPGTVTVTVSRETRNQEVAT